MRKEYNFSKGKRGPIVPIPRGKTRITIRLDDDVLEWFRGQVRSSGGSYQTLINLALRDYIAREPLEATLRRVVREELVRAAGAPPESAYAYGPQPQALVADAADAGTDYGPTSERREPEPTQTRRIAKGRSRKRLPSRRKR
jgi:hypothetical protein